MDCEFKDDMLKARVTSCLTGTYNPILHQLQYMPYIDLQVVTVNRILREVYVDDIA